MMILILVVTGESVSFCFKTHKKEMREREARKGVAAKSAEEVDTVEK